MDSVFDREQVLKFFRVLCVECRQIEGKSLRIMPPNADSVFSKGYQIHISPNNDEITEGCVQKIARQSKLATATEGNILIVFNPLTKN